MPKHFYRSEVTDLIDELDDDFAALFPSFKMVSERVAEKGTTVEENAAAVEALNETPTVEVPVVAEKTSTTKKTDSSKEGND